MRKIKHYKRNHKRALNIAALIFQYTGWEWVHVGVPNREEVKQCLKSLENSVINGSSSASTGRITVEYDDLLKELRYSLSIS